MYVDTDALPDDPEVEESDEADDEEDEDVDCPAATASREPAASKLENSIVLNLLHSNGALRFRIPSAVQELIHQGKSHSVVIRII